MRISDDIHNYYEKMVVKQFTEMKLDDSYDTDFMADLTCVVLNQLPTRYIRHEVDMAFYLPPSERFEMETKVNKAISRSLEFMKQHKLSS